MGASKNVILRLCDPVDQPSADLCANLCPAHLKSHRIFFVTVFERTRQSAWLDAVTTRGEWQEASEFLCTKNTSFWRELSNQKYRQKKPEMLSPTRY